MHPKLDLESLWYKGWKKKIVSDIYWLYCGGSSRGAKRKGSTASVFAITNSLGLSLSHGLNIFFFKNTSSCAFPYKTYIQLELNILRSSLSLKATDLHLVSEYLELTESDSIKSTFTSCQPFVKLLYCKGHFRMHGLWILSLKINPCHSVYAGDDSRRTDCKPQGEKKKWNKEWGMGPLWHELVVLLKVSKNKTVAWQ